MIYLVLIGIAIVAVLVWFLARPMAGGEARGASDRAQLEMLRDRLLTQLNELDAELADHALDRKVAGDEQLRLEAELAAVLKQLENPAASASPAGAGGRPQWLATLIVFAVLLPAAGGVLYLFHGQPVEPDAVAAQQAGGGVGGEGVPPMVMQMVQRLEARLAEHPDDVDGWARLARSYQVLGRNQDALKAYARAYELAPDDREILGNYAMFMFQLHPGVTQGKVYELFQRLYALEPANPGASWFLGLAAYQEGDFAQAVQRWQQTLKNLPPDSPVVSSVQKAIEQARAEMKKK